MTAISIIKGLNGLQKIEVDLETIDACMTYIAQDPSSRSLYLSRRNTDENLVERLSQHEKITRVRRLSIMSSTQNIQLFESLDCIEEINFGEPNIKFDFSKLKNLKSIGGVWSKLWTSLDSCSALQSVQVSKFPGPIQSIPNLSKLTRLSLIQPSLSTLTGLAHAACLVELDISIARKLESIDSLISCKQTLTKLKLDSCRKITSYDVLEKLINLTTLHITASASLESISFIQKLPKLVSLSIYETNLIDNNLNTCISHPQLVDFRSENKRSYFPSLNDIETFLKGKNIEVSSV